jgi:tetratricopeptide (TPR) repeat protein
MSVAYPHGEQKRLWIHLLGKMYIRALEGYKTALGAEHISTLNTVNNLGNLYYNQGKLAEAENIYVRALEGYKKVLGAEHTSTLDTVNNLGILYRRQGKLAEAEIVFRRATQGRATLLGSKQIGTDNITRQSPEIPANGNPHGSIRNRIRLLLKKIKK